jgi:AMP nucleosidase
MRTSTLARADSRLSYGFVAGPGVYETTLTRPDLFAAYYLEQLRLLLDNHHVPLEIGTSSVAIPAYFAFDPGEHVEATMTSARQLLMQEVFDFPDLAAMDDGIAAYSSEVDRQIR